MIERNLATFGALITLLTALACGDTGQERIGIPLSARGVASTEFEVGGYTVTLSEARVGVGPIYVCASARSSTDLCPTAVAELTDSATVDALDPERQEIGELAALTSTARSIGLDYAITWPASLAQPLALDGAPSSHSARFAGHADNGERSFTFTADIDLAPLVRGSRAVEGLSTRAELRAGLRCELELDPIAWWSQVDFSELAERATEVVVIDVDFRAYATLVAAMTSNATPRFAWPRASNP